MSLTQQLPRRNIEQNQGLPDTAPAGFTTSNEIIDPLSVAPDMDLRVRPPPLPSS
jgi:hypothetical protein